MDSYRFNCEFEELPLVEQAMAVLGVLQSAAARGDAYLVEWALEQSALYEFYGDDEQLLMFEICSAASVAIQKGYVDVVGVLIKHFRDFSQELILECVGEMYRQSQNHVDLKPAIAWMCWRVRSADLDRIWDQTEDCDTLAALSWFKRIRNMVMVAM